MARVLDASHGLLDLQDLWDIVRVPGFADLRDPPWTPITQPRLQPGEDKLPGPNLRCLLGRPAGALAGFEFSPALTEAGRARGLVWTRETLDAFLADPQRVVPGTEMSLPGLPDPGDRQDVIDYLAQAGPCTGSAGGADGPSRQVARTSRQPSP